MKEHSGHGRMASGMKMSGKTMSVSPYRMFAVNMAVSFVVMYFAMFAMIYSLGELYNNINTFYMALMMAAPMGILMLWMMKSMFENQRLNMVLYAGFSLMFVLAYFGIRSQALVDDKQFLRSMIPHHSGAILMCEQASLQDPEIKSLCANIVVSQKQEIDKMKQLLHRP
jgi:hypothetical protein